MVRKLRLNENDNKDYVEVYTISNNMSILIVRFNYGIEDTVEWIYSGDYEKYGLDDNYIHESVIEDDFGDDEEYYADWYDYDTNGGRQYFLAGNYRVYLDKCERV